jgi:ParB family chromosome partitioning protein
VFICVYLWPIFFSLPRRHFGCSAAQPGLDFIMQKNKSRLGRGMDSLLSIPGVPEPVIEDEVSDAKPLEPATDHPPASVLASPIGVDGLFHVELERVVANPHQPRRTFEPAALAQLADSLKTSGLIQPIVIRPVESHYELVAGERRLRAARLAGLRTLPAIVKDIDRLQQAQLALIENIHREDLNPIERALAYRQLIDQLGLTQEELSVRLGEERSSIANFIRLLDLSDIARQAVIDRKMTMGHAKLLAGIRDPAEQQRLTELVISQELSVRNLERLLAGAPKPVVKPIERTSSAHIIDLEKRLSRTLEMRVEVKQAKKGGRGRLVIHYASLDQFDDLLARLKFEAE